MLGSKTITNVNRVGTRFALNKSYTETTEERPLLNPRELMDLEEGENVVLRTMYRRDLKGNQIKPRPIFNSRKEDRAFLYRYQYLQDYFPDADTVSEESLHLPTLKTVQPDEMMYNYDISFEAAKFAQLPKQMEEIQNEIKRMEDGGALEEDIEDLDEVYRQMEEEKEKLAKKQLYQWDTPMAQSEDEEMATHEKQLLQFCEKLGEYDLEICQLLNQTCTAGELLVQVTNSTSIPFKEKYNLLLQLKGKLGLA